MFTHRFQSSRRDARGFTLVELMVAVALVLVLIIGINEVFRVTSDTIGVGQSLSSALRDQRAVRTTFESDFGNVAQDAPALVIRNQAVAAFRSRDEQLGNVDPANPLRVDLNADGNATGPGEQISPATPGDRVRRIDSVTFFVRKPLRRQTGNLDPSSGLPTDLLGTSTTAEAMVTYGHLRLPNNRAIPSYYDPGQADLDNPGGDRNDNNKFASQFVLGRQQMLLVPYVPENNTAETTWRPTAVSAINSPLNLSPLSMATVGLRNNGAFPNLGNVPALGRQARPFDSLVDVATSEPSSTSDDLYVRTPLTLTSFAQRLAQYERDVAATGGAFGSTYAGTANSGLWFLPAASNTYTTALARETLVFRAQANPFGTRSYNGTNNTLSTTLAQTSPIFLSRCTSFIVEFAGDFISQDNRQIVGVANNPSFGAGYDGVPDGEIDYVVYKGTRRIRWYGLPRYTNSGDVDAIATGSGYVGPRVRGRPGPGFPSGSAPNGNSFTSLNTNQIPDVVPLSDVLTAIANSASRTTAPFEKVIMTNRTEQGPGEYFYDLDGRNNGVVASANFLPPQTNYADTITNAFTLQRANYITAFTGGRGPKLLRITLTLEDPTSRSNTAQTYEYIFTLPN